MKTLSRWRAWLLVATAAGLLCTGVAVADPPGPPPHSGHSGGFVYDGRYHHNRYYPPPGYVVPQLPHGYHDIHYGHDHYYYGGGIWYRPYGPRFAVVAPPVGIVVSILPDFYTTVWFGGVPYYYANSVYYVWRPDVSGYVVTDPPTGEPQRTEPPATAASDDFFVYPRNGQSADQQSRDRYECHRWAVSQTGFDPTQSQGGVPASQAASRRSDYFRAISACLDARGYTVR